jgi:hypothetical protein
LSQLLLSGIKQAITQLELPEGVSVGIYTAVAMKTGLRSTTEHEKLTPVFIQSEV